MSLATPRSMEAPCCVSGLLGEGGGWCGLITTNTCEVTCYHENITLYCFASDITCFKWRASQLKESALGRFFWSRLRGWRWPFSHPVNHTPPSVSHPSANHILFLALRMRRIWRWRGLFISSPRPTQKQWCADCRPWLASSFVLLQSIVVRFFFLKQ